MELGIVGLPNVGKTTLFNALTAAGAEVANYPFCTIDRNVGMVEVPDIRLEKLAEILTPPKVTSTVIEFVDIAGLVKGASQGEGLGNEFLGHVRNVDAIIHVVRCFEDENVSHVSAGVDPVVDIDVISSELIAADLKSVEKRLEKCSRGLKSGDKEIKEEFAFLNKLSEVLNSGKPVRDMDISEAEEKLMREYQLLTSKKMLYAVNVDEESLIAGENNLVSEIEDFIKDQKSELITICAKIESELVELEPDERLSFLEEMGVGPLGLEKLITASYRLLDLITFYTANENEMRARTISRGTKAPQAAGKVHTDMEKGFIRAEVIHYEDLIKAGSMKAAKDKGLMHLEGKDYVVMDGEMMYFRFQA